MGFFIKESHYQRSADKAIGSIIDLIALNDNGAIIDIGAETALLQSDIFTAIRIIAGDIATADYTTSNDALVEDLFTKKANSSTTSYTFLFTLIANTLLTGQGFALIERDKEKGITGLRNIKSSKVTVLESEDEKELGYKILDSKFSGEYSEKDIIHLKAFSTDGKLGVSPISALKPEIAMQKNGVSLLVNSFKKGISTSGILKLAKGNLNNESKKTIRESFEEANSGSSNSGSVMVLGEGEEFKQLEVDTKVLDMIQNNKYSTQQIAKTFGIPLSRFGQELVNSKDTDANDIYIASTLNTYKTMMKQECDDKLDTDLSIEFSTLTGQAKQTLLSKLIQDKQGEGVLMINEVRDFYGVDALPAEIGDIIFKNSASKDINELKGGE
ncbi:phage portal protein [Enterococcus sp. LJL99]